MCFYGLFFEINDKMISVEAMYIYFVSLGIIGLLLSFRLGWFGLIWLIFPTLFSAFLFISMQNEEVTFMREQIVKELGENYIFHNYISVFIGIVLNLGGVFINLINSKKISLK